MKNIIRNLLIEKDKVSLTRFIAVTAWIAFLLVSFYLVFSGKEWGNYEVFATFTAGGGAVTQVVNKYINTKYKQGKGEEE